MVQRKPSILSQGLHEAHQICLRALLAQNNSLEGLLEDPTAPAYWTEAGQQHVLGDFCRNHRQLNSLPSPLDPSAIQVGGRQSGGRCHRHAPRVG